MIKFFSVFLLITALSPLPASSQISEEESFLESLMSYRHSLAFAQREGDLRIAELQQNSDSYLPILASWLTFPSSSDLLSYAGLTPRYSKIIGILRIIDTPESKTILKSAYYIVAPHVNELNRLFNLEVKNGTPRNEFEDLMYASSAAESIHGAILIALSTLNDDSVLSDVLSRLPQASAISSPTIIRYNNTVSTEKILADMIVLDQPWNLIGMPLSPVLTKSLDVFPASSLKAGPLTWNIDTYVDTPNLAMGQGYWVRANYVGWGQNIFGSENQSITLNLSPGWNMIGGPSCDISVASAIDPTGIIVPGSLRGFEYGYQSNTLLVQGEGYWIQTTAAGQVTFDCNAPIKETPFPIPEPPSTFGRIAVQAALSGYQLLYFGSTLPKGHPVSYAMPPLPPAGLFDARFVSNARLEEDSTVEVRLQSDVYPMKVTLLKPPDGATDFVLEELVLDQVVATHPLDAPVVISNSEVTAFRIR